MAHQDERQPARKFKDEQGEVAPAESLGQAYPSGEADAEQDKHNPHLPENKPQYKLPSRPAYSSGKRRPTRFAR